MATWHSEILITTNPLQSPPHYWSGAPGATVDFWGVVRAGEDGREISGIEYEAHREMAEHQMEQIAELAAPQFGLLEVRLQHRIGFVATGEASLFLRVSSPHRGAAYDGSAWIVAELKKKVPIWKRPIFVRQEHGAVPA
ncbi:MAG: molybdenum cofactor biosynthesis protein MoaE [Spartobacteria bacterium]